MNVYEETQLILHKYKIQANKSLGQNFLVDDNVIDEIIRSSNINKQDLIIEIGPGLGVLTNRLLQEANNIIAVELDKRMVNILQDRFILNINGQAESKLKIINEDVLKINLNEIIAEKRKQTEIKNVKIVANLPYYISTPIIMKLLENRLDIDEIIVMVQKEVAERLTAKTGTRLAGAITYAVEYYSDATGIIKVSKETFLPHGCSRQTLNAHSILLHKYAESTSLISCFFSGSPNGPYTFLTESATCFAVCPLLFFSHA